MINKRLRYLHWAIFVLVTFMLITGFCFDSMADKETRFFWMKLHKATGTLIFWLMILRLYVRMKFGLPSLPFYGGGFSMFQNKMARLGQGFLYVLLFAIPIDGFMMSQFSGYPVPFYGLFNYPQLVEKSKDMAGFFHGWHEPLAWTALIIICLHILGALKHRFIDKDNVFQRMVGG